MRLNKELSSWRGLRLSGLVGLLTLALMSGSRSLALAGDVSVAVAANFLETLKALQIGFEQESGHRLTLSAGSTGELYIQVVNGAPYDVFLAADQKRPEALEKDNQAVSGSRFTYAIGRLVLWSADAELISDDGPAVLKAGSFRRLAIANLKTAPYGEAALQVLKGLGVYEALEPRIVLGQSLSQAYQFVATGAAELGFVAFPHVRAAESGGSLKGSFWLVPQELYDPILQDAVLLTRGKDNDAALAFLGYLKSAEARRIIEDAGYSVVAP